MVAKYISSVPQRPRSCTSTPAARSPSIRAADSDIDEARQSLAAAGFDAETELVAGEPEDVLPALVKAQGAALLVMGAYGHSRIRHLIVGSTTTTLLRVSDVPVLILR